MAWMMANKPLWSTRKVYLSFLSQQVSVCFESMFWLLVAQEYNTERQVLRKRKQLFRGSQQSQREGGLMSQRTNSFLLIRGWELLKGKIRGAYLIHCLFSHKWSLRVCEIFGPFIHCLSLREDPDWLSKCLSPTFYEKGCPRSWTNFICGIDTV